MGTPNPVIVEVNGGTSFHIFCFSHGVQNALEKIFYSKAIKDHFINVIMLQ